MGVDPEVMAACAGLDFRKDYVSLWSINLVQEFISFYNRNRELYMPAILDVGCNANNLVITLNGNNVFFELNGYVIWEEPIDHFDGESWENINWLLLAYQNGRLPKEGY